MVIKYKPGCGEDALLKTAALKHDYNNSIQSIISMLELLQQRVNGGIDGGVDDLIEAGHRALDRVGEQARGLAQNGQSRSPPLVHLNRCISGLNSQLASLLGSCIELSMSISEEDLWISADLHRLESAIINLVLNARDAMPNGGKLIIQTGLVQDGKRQCSSYASLRIIDNGCGMAAAILARALDFSYTTKHSQAGRGLGLWSVRDFVSDLQGEIVLRSIVNEGTSAELLLPLQE
ncbi:ATP-binding protein [Tardiphaga sp. P9-11]|uniref:ATP-binding protein n=1 Tax=Tardiphaga sp. P9-11 TaxID=2024614 RepID=UPI0011F1DC2F|nr:ATP-binding protein [Tardiphaga sp. P9-11]KAA0069980.1 hypothetical protein CIW50_27825 [Tardiphaga sp. P9-11]